MVRKSLLKRASYFGSALMLVLATVPIIPSGRALATDLPTDLVLEADSSECYTIPMDKTVTLDLAGHTLSCGIMVEAGANLTITGNGSVTTSAAGQAAIYNKVGGTVIIVNGTFNSTNWYTIKNLGTMVINGGTFTQGAANASNASMVANGWYDGHNGGASDQGNAYTGTVANLTINGGTFNHYTTTSTIKSDDYSKTTINGGNFTSQNGYLLQATGDVTVNDGDFTGYDSMIVFNATGEAPYEPGVAKITGGTVNAKYLATGSKGVLSVEGGTFAGLERIVRNTSDVIEDDGIVGGSYNIPVKALLADGKVNYKEGSEYVVADAPDMSGVPARIMARVGEATEIAGLSDEVLAHSNVTVSRLGTFADGAVTASGVGTFDVKIKPEIYTTDGGGAVVRDTAYDKSVKVHSYDFDDVNVVLPVDNEETLAVDTVRVDEQYDQFEYSIADPAVATIDAGGKITAVGSGSTDVYATVSIASLPDVNVRVKIGTVYVYDFNSIEETYLIKAGDEAEILADSAWDLTTATTATNIDIIKDGNNFRINGQSAGLAEINFAATIGGENVQKPVKAYVYKVNGQAVVVKKGETISEGEISRLIDKGHDDVTMRVEEIDDNSIATNDGLALTGVEAGETVATYRLAVGANDADVSVNVHVWDFVTENLADVYDLGNKRTATDAFKVYDKGGEISYTVKNAAGEDASDAIIVKKNGDEYTIEKAADTEAGEYLVEFVDKVMGEKKDGKTVKVRVHEIVVPGETEYYMVMDQNLIGNYETLYLGRVTEANGYSRPRDIRSKVTPLGGLNVLSLAGYTTLVATGGGSYTVTFSDDVASAEINVYVINFTFGQNTYHVRREDGHAGEVIEAINEYWHEVNVVEGYTDTKFIMVNNATGAVVAESDGYEYVGSRTEATSDKHTFKWCNTSDCLEAGDYTITFEAYANRGDAHGGKTASKSVNLYVYEMTAPQENLYFAEVGDQVEIEVGDLNGRASTRAEIISGPEGGLEFETSGWWIFAQTDYSKINALAPGEYTVRYTDYMGNGEIAGTYEATIVVIEVENEEVYVRRGETITLTGSEAWDASFAKDGMTGVDYEVENGKIVFDTTGMELGKHIVEIAHDFSEFDEGEFPPREMVKITTVVVWDVSGDIADDMETDEDRATVADFVAEKIAKMIENESTSDEQVELWIDIDTLKDALHDGVEITTRLEVELVDEADWEYTEAYDQVVLKIEDENGIVAMYEVFLTIYAGDEEIGLVYEIDDPITLRLAIPAEYTTTPDGYIRKFYVVRGHSAIDGTDTAEVLEITRDGDYLVFKNNKFSSFAIAYTDELIPAAPDTGFVVNKNGSGSASTSNLVVAIVTLIGAVTLAGVAVFAKRK